MVPRWSPEVPQTDNFLRPVPKTDNILRPFMGSIGWPFKENRKMLKGLIASLKGLIASLKGLIASLKGLIASLKGLIAILSDFRLKFVYFNRF